MTNLCVEESVTRDGDTAHVRGYCGYIEPGMMLCSLKDTENGYIAHFPSHSPSYQDYYVCLDYSQARDLVLALSAFKEELGFAEAETEGVS